MGWPRAHGREVAVPRGTRESAGWGRAGLLAPLVTGRGVGRHRHLSEPPQLGSLLGGSPCTAEWPQSRRCHLSGRLDVPVPCPTLSRYAQKEEARRAVAALSPSLPCVTRVSKTQATAAGAQRPVRRPPDPHRSPWEGKQDARCASLSQTRVCVCVCRGVSCARTWDACTPVCVGPWACARACIMHTSHVHVVYKRKMDETSCITCNVCACR